MRGPSRLSATSRPETQRALYLSPKYTEKDWTAALEASEDWGAAIDVIEDRVKGRWLDAADSLLDQPYSGFAILALDCIVLESLWGFMNGKPVPRPQDPRVYREILTGPRFGWKAGLSGSFHDLVRNGLMHDAETRIRWLVKKTVPRDVIARRNKSGDYELNRTKFHTALKGTFADWLAKLRSSDTALRENMRDRMNQIIAKHYGN